MLIRNPYTEIGNIYSGILNESPDSIYINGRALGYAEEFNFTGYLNSSGRFVISSSVESHEQLRNTIMADYFYIEGLKKKKNKIPLKTNCNSEAELKALVRNATDYDSFRIWSSHDIISFWSKPANEIFHGVINALKALGEDPKKYTYDFSSDDEFDYLTYAEFKSECLKSGDEFSSNQIKLSQDKRAWADYTLRRKDGD